jgi:hypothetical protein
MTSTDRSVAAGDSRRLEFAPGAVIVRAKRVARQHPVLIAAAVLVAGGGGAASAAVALKSSNSVPAIASDCGSSVSGRGFRVFACMSGGARAGHPHPKELLVVRNDGSSVAYPAFRVGEFAVGDGEVVATYDLNLVRVTSSRLVPLLTSGELARALHVQPTAIMDIYDPTVDAQGDIYLIASVLSLSHSGCQNPLLERTAGGTVHQIRSSTSRNNICG